MRSRHRCNLAGVIMTTWRMAVTRRLAVVAGNSGKVSWSTGVREATVTVGGCAATTASLSRSPRAHQAVDIEDPVVGPQRHSRCDPIGRDVWRELPQHSEAVAGFLLARQVPQNRETDVEGREMTGNSFQHCFR